MVFQQGQHIRCLIGIGINTPFIVRTGVQAQTPEPAQRVGGMDRVLQRAQRGGIRREIACLRTCFVIQIAAAIAGSQQLFAQARVAFQHRHMGRRVCLRSGQRRRQPGGTTAQNHDLLHKMHQPFLLFFLL